WPRCGRSGSPSRPGGSTHPEALGGYPGAEEAPDERRGGEANRHGPLDDLPEAHPERDLDHPGAGDGAAHRDEHGAGLLVGPRLTAPSASPAVSSTPITTRPAPTAAAASRAPSATRWGWWQSSSLSL